MRRKMLSMTLAAALLLSVTALAEEGQSAPPDAPAAQMEAAAVENGADSAQPEPGEGSPALEEPEYIPDPVGSLSFQNLETRMREGNLSMLALEENIQSIQVTDFDKMYEDLRKGLNGIASAQWMMTSLGQGGSYASAAMSQSYASMRETFEDLKSGKIQKNSADAVRQLENAQDQMVMAAQSIYIALAEMELTGQSLDRSLAALDRSLQELELRHQMGQISSLTLKQAQGGRVSLVSGQQTLDMNMENLNIQLELMAGGELTGQTRLGPLPAVTPEQLGTAKLALDGARDAYWDAGGSPYYENDTRYQFQSAKHTWQAAQHTYNAAVQNFETAFRTLYLQVKDYQQVLAAARTSLAVEEDSFAAAQLKFEQGTISQNALLEAKDKVSAAQETVDGAEIDLFSAYNNYRWAVDRGILN